MTDKELMALDSQYIMHTYGRNQVVLVSGSGCVAKDINGKEYLDCTSGIGVNALGYCNPDWAAAVAKQASTLQHTSNLYYTEPCIKLAEKVCTKSGMDKIFFGNSGAEANEGAIKCARKYSYDHYGEGRDTIVTLVNSFHGRTIATLTATGQEHYHEFFGPFNGHFAYAEANNIESLKSVVDEHVCAVMLEMIQGEGGVMALDADYVKAVGEFCAERDILVIVDEVQTGIGRTGKFFSWMNYEIKPDICSMAKGLGGGMPIGAVLVKEKVAECMTPGTHGSTFGGNPVVCAGGCVVMDTLTDEFLAEVADKAAYFRAKLAKLPHVTEVTGIGLMIGLGFGDGIKAGDVLKKAQDAGLLVLTAKARLRLLPPLIMTKEEMDKAAAILESVMKSF